MNSHRFQRLFTSLDGAMQALENSPATTPRSGRVLSSKDGVCIVEGISGVGLGDVVSVEDVQVPGLVMQVETGRASVVLLRGTDAVKPGHVVSPSGRTLTVPVGTAVVGRVLDPLGEPLDDGAPLLDAPVRTLECSAPGVMDRESVHEPLQTGILAIDALVPIGRGQRELIIGDRQTGKTSIALDAILNQKGRGVRCVYVAIGQRDGKTAQVIRELQRSGAMEYTTVIVAAASSPAVMQYLAPYAGQAIAEEVMYGGGHALIVFDDLSKQAVAYREMSLLLRRPPGREAYPGDVFYIHSRLLERSAKLSAEKGGGSITALPIIETQAADVSAYIPTNVISITDGQIFLEPGLFYRGVRPAINVGISVSRVGGAAQSKAMKKVAGTAKLELAQYYELAAFSQFASELDETSKRQLTRGERLIEALKQGVGDPHPLWREVLFLYAVQNGYLDAVERTEVGTKLHAFTAFVQSAYPDIAEDIERQAVLDEQLSARVAQAAQAFFAPSR